MGEPGPLPDVSVVVAVVTGKPDFLTRCLEALRAQEDPPETEVLVPFDPEIHDFSGVQRAFPEVRFVAAEGLGAHRSARGVFHEHYDALRTLGIECARGRSVALTEDHVVVGPRWCRALTDALGRWPAAGAVGGAIECGGEEALARAVTLCDFGRYQSPLPQGPSRCASDTNVVYRREALEQARDAWVGGYRETVVHAALTAAGWSIALASDAVAWQRRSPLSLPAVLRERCAWGRYFAGTRLAGRPLAVRLAFALGTPLLPGLLTMRVVRTAWQRGRLDRAFAAALPLVALLHGAWALGEFVGYGTGHPSPPRALAEAPAIAAGRASGTLPPGQRRTEGRGDHRT